MIFNIKPSKPKPLVKMVTHGKRAYGEDWREVTVGVKDDKIQVIENVATAAPPDNRPIYVPGMGQMAMEQVDFLLEGARKAQEYGGKHPSQMSLKEYSAWLNRIWLDYVEQKLMWFKGRTTIGPAGFHQREKPGRTNWTGA